MPKPLLPPVSGPAERTVPSTVAKRVSGPDGSADGKRSKNLPAHEFRHRSLRVTVWKNDTAKGAMYNVTMSRMYRSNESWKDSQSFGYDDLMNLAKLLFDAHSYISSLSRGAGAAAAKRQKQSRRAPAPPTAH
jgi:hypothetical protein